MPAKRARLDLARAFDALLDGRGELARTAIRQLLVGDARHVEMDVDAVQQRPTDPLLIAADRSRGAGAGAARVAEVPAGTPVQIVIMVLFLLAPTALGETPLDDFQDRLR